MINRICEYCAHNEQDNSLALEPYRLCCLRDWHCKPGSIASDFLPKQTAEEIKLGRIEHEGPQLINATCDKLCHMQVNHAECAGCPLKRLDRLIREGK